MGLAKTFTKKESEGKLSADPCSDFFFECYPYLFDTGVGADEDDDANVVKKGEALSTKSKTGGGVGVGSSSSTAGAYTAQRPEFEQNRIVLHRMPGDKNIYRGEFDLASSLNLV